MKTLSTTTLLLCLLTCLGFANASIFAQPINDHIENAIDLDESPTPFTDINVDFGSATLQGDQTGNQSCTPILPGIWYKFTARTAANVSTNIINPAASAWIVYFTAPNENVTDASELTYYDDPGNSCGIGGFRAVDVTPNTTYYIYARNSNTTDITLNIEAAILPSNDIISDATNLNLGPAPYTDTEVHFDLATSLSDATSASSGCALTQAGIWYTFTATKNGNVSAGILSPNSPVVVFFTGPENASTGQQLTYVNQTNNICDFSPLGSINATSGTTYYIYMKNTSTSSVSINVTNAFAVPENDLIENAIDVNGLTSFVDPDVHFVTVTNTNDSGQLGGCDSGQREAIWYKFTAQTDGEVIAETSETVRGYITFYQADNENVTSGSELTYVDQVNNNCLSSELSIINAEAGTTYYLNVAAGSTPYVDININLSGVLGLQDNSLDGFSFYPNPVLNELNLEAKNTIDEIKIYNVLGQLVNLERVGANKTKISLSGLKVGIYILHVFSEGTAASYKILKK